MLPASLYHRSLCDSSDQSLAADMFRMTLNLNHIDSAVSVYAEQKSCWVKKKQSAAPNTLFQDLRVIGTSVTDLVFTSISELHDCFIQCPSPEVVARKL